MCAISCVSVLNFKCANSKLHCCWLITVALVSADGTPTFTTTPRPAQIMYGARLKFVNLGDNFVLPTRGSREYTALQERVSKALEATELSLVPGFEEVVVDKFRA